MTQKGSSASGSHPDGSRDITKGNLEKHFGQPSGAEATEAGRVDVACLMLAKTLLDECPGAGYRQLALLKLQEARQLAQLSITTGL